MADGGHLGFLFDLKEHFKVREISLLALNYLENGYKSITAIFNFEIERVYLDTIFPMIPRNFYAKGDICIMI